MKPPRGFVFLYIILIAAVVLAALSLTASTTGAFTGGRMRLYQQSAEVRVLAMHCAETLLMQVRNSTTLTGSGSLTQGTGSCAYTITGSSVPKTISITATKNNLTKRLTVTVSATTPTLTTTWIEGS